MELQDRMFMEASDRFAPRFKYISTFREKRKRKRKLHPGK